MNAIMLHGTECTPDLFWFPSIRMALESKNNHVWVPELPNPESPSLETTLPFILENGKFTKDTILIGHSSGCALILGVLEKINVKIAKAILVAGFARPINGPNPVLKKWEWDKIRNKSRDFIFINSDNDPYGCDQSQGAYMFEHLGGTLIIRHGDGHFGSAKYNQPFLEFPLLRRLIR